MFSAEKYDNQNMFVRMKLASNPNRNLFEHLLQRCSQNNHINDFEFERFCFQTYQIGCFSLVRPLKSIILKLSKMQHGFCLFAVQSFGVRFF